jgi:flagellar assembly protein FliH
MPSSSRAKLLREVPEAKGFVYKAPGTMPGGNGTAPGNLPAGTQLLWSQNQAPDGQLGAEQPPHEDEVKVREREAWEKGFQAALAQTRDNLEKSMAAERARMATALAEFAQVREEYYHKVEGEVVNLVLSIARRILRRESQVDPMLLRGMVRVALERMAHATTVKLCVPSTQAEAWQAEVGSMPRRDLSVDVVPDESLTAPSCVIVTEMGSTKISTETQLGEIEHGFLDLLADRPGIRESGFGTRD